MEFRILGPLEVLDGSTRVDVGGGRQQVVLAMLLLSVNAAVSGGRLLEAAYGEDPPPTARSQLYNSISALRHVLRRHDGARILTRGRGYLLEVRSERVDACQFKNTLATAVQAREAGHYHVAIARYREALRMWRGPALDGVDSLLARVGADRLNEQRMAAIGERIDLELSAGRHYELVGELSELRRKFPLRERFCGQLMLALYRCGRTAEALEVYRHLRNVMISELAIEPTGQLQQLEHAILNADPGLVPAPRQKRQLSVAGHSVSLLPADVADFTGRSAELKQIGRQLTRYQDGTGASTVPVVVVTGKPGAGKTILAVRAGHDVARWFPDGQLFADLHAGTARLVHPLYILERFLRALGVTGSQIPDGLDERAAIYRGLLAGRRVLVVLDDAASEAQVMPLVPGNGSSAMVVTSRRRLTGLPGAVHVKADVFVPGVSVELLGRIIGESRVRAQPRDAAAVAAYCGHLPLALRIAGARLSEGSHWSIRHMAERLADKSRRLDELRHGNLSIRSSISRGYESASLEARGLFRRLALFDQRYFSSWQSAALIDRPLAETEDLLDELASSHLLETADGEDDVCPRFWLHDLIQAFARERLLAEEPIQEHGLALQRVLAREQGLSVLPSRSIL